MQFLHIQSGWEGPVVDAQMFHNARFTNLPVPDGKYFLADAEFPTCSSLLIPYCGPQYHLAEWGRAQLQYRYYCYHYTVAHHPNFVVLPPRRVIQFATHEGSECHREGIWSNQTMLQDLNHPT